MKAFLLQAIGFVILLAVVLAALGLAICSGLIPGVSAQTPDDDAEMRDSSWTHEPDPCAPPARAREWLEPKKEKSLP